MSGKLLGAKRSYDGATDPCCCGIVCGLKYQIKAATATLCGFAEYTSPSSPPKAYHKAAKTGSLEEDIFGDSGCAGQNMSGSKTLRWDFAGGTGGNFCETDWTWSLSGTTLSMQVVYTGYVSYNGHSSFDGEWYHWNGSIWVLISSFNDVFDIPPDSKARGPNTYNWTYTIPLGTAVLFRLQQSGGKTYDVTISGAATVVQDTWDLTRDYAPGLAQNPPVCSLTTTDNSTRKINGTPSGSPSEDDYANLDTITLTKTSRKLEGTGTCVKISDTPLHYAKLTGSETESLTDEDTEPAAIARANAAITNWTTCGTGVGQGWQDCTAYNAVRGAGQFSLSYRSARYAINEDSLVAGKLYQAQVDLYRRAYPSSDEWILYTQVFFQFTAQPGSAPTYFDIPSVSGAETGAADCILTPV